MCVTKHERIDHCKVCTQCDYWQRKIEIYRGKINKHIEQVKTAAKNTAAFNSFTANRQSPATASGTLASFGRGSTKNLINRKGSMQESIGTCGADQSRNMGAAPGQRESLNGNGTAHFNF